MISFSVKKVEYTTTVYSDSNIARGRLTVYGKIQHDLDNDRSLQIRDIHETVLNNKANGTTVIRVVIMYRKEHL